MNIIAKIDVQQIKKNIDFLKNKSGSDIMVVLKDNAYGHGLTEIAKICRKLKVKYIGVATLGEALKIRNSGDKGKILAWIYDPRSPEVKESLDKNIELAIFDEKHIPIINKITHLRNSNSENVCEKDLNNPKDKRFSSNQMGIYKKNSERCKKKSNVHLFVDIGINRNGIPYEKALNAAKKIEKSPYLNLVGLMGHLCCYNNKKTTTEELKKFRELRKIFEDNNIKPNLVHIANTDVIFTHNVSDFNLARCGTGVFGIKEIVPSQEIKPVLSLESKIIQLKEVPKGSGIGYHHRFFAPKKIIIAIVPIGYGDGLPQSKITVDINGTKRKVLGLESMDQITVEGKKGDKEGDVVKIFGNKEGFSNNLITFSKKAKVKPFEMCVHLSDRIKRIY